jgi:transcriptional regulator with XRE-family HTH domain
MELINAGDCLKKAQKLRSINSRELARLTNSSPQQVLRWRSNKNMKMHTLQILCVKLGIEIEEFIKL